MSISDWRSDVCSSELSRRSDNQLRGRSGRQGDPGASKFFLSLEDDLMRIFGSERMDSMLQKLGLQEGEAIVHAWVNKALEKAQQKVEARHFEGRKYRSEEHTSELQSLMRISYAVFC